MSFNLFWGTSASLCGAFTFKNQSQCLHLVLPSLLGDVAAVKAACVQRDTELLWLLIMKVATVRKKNARGREWKRPESGLIKQVTIKDELTLIRKKAKNCPKDESNDLCPL